ncbi:MAG: EamA family transporter [Aromatoleum sp.]|jgi:drug/metabolite transporter (DMT)-like permease|uniref:DMT family transporter n=1 Tax=Aromatoleum sp. TaxID=2307007 RepID=UPI002893DDB0|nr:EamA family transporter [Aromatoleum sp.]MDT3672492.1 EamA family transporter [Aromatoleum sp.]
MNKKRIPLAALGLFVLLSLIWGYNWVVMKKVMAYADPFDFSALRTLFGALALFAVLAWRRKPLKPVALGQTLLLGLLQTTAFTALIQWALVSGGAGKTAVLVYAMPFWLLPMAWVFLGERVRGLQWLAVALALVGLVFILDPWNAEGDLFSTSLALLASVSWAASAVIVKRIRARFDVDLLSLTAWQMLLGAVVLCGVAWLLPSEPPQLTTYFIVALVYNALFATGLAWLIWLVILDRLPAGLAGLSSLAVPAVGVLSGWLELGERPSGPESAGMLCIAVALLLISAIALRARELQARSVSADSRS